MKLADAKTKPPVDMLCDWIEESYRAVAPKKMLAELEAQQQRLTDNEAKLRAKIEAFRTKKEVIKAQYSAAEAQVKISEAANGVGEEMALVPTGG